jgi:hypothetical protein
MRRLLLSIGVLIGLVQLVACGGGGGIAPAPDAVVSPPVVAAMPEERVGAAAVAAATVEEDVIEGLSPPDLYLQLVDRGFTKSGPIAIGNHAEWRLRLKMPAADLQVEIISGRSVASVQRICATALSWSPTVSADDAARDFLAMVASVPYRDAVPADAQAWVAKNTGRKTAKTFGHVRFELFAATPGTARILEIRRANATGAPETTTTEGAIDQSSVATKPEPRSAVTPEQQAATKLANAKRLKTSNAAAYRRWLSEIVRDWPDTQAGHEAAELLKAIR